jgi:hypothetical protein
VVWRHNKGILHLYVWAKRIICTPSDSTEFNSWELARVAFEPPRKVCRAAWSRCLRTGLPREAPLYGIVAAKGRRKCRDSGRGSARLRRRGYRERVVEQQQERSTRQVGILCEVLSPGRGERHSLYVDVRGACESWAHGTSKQTCSLRNSALAKRLLSRACKQAVRKPQRGRIWYFSRMLRTLSTGIASTVRNFDCTVVAFSSEL